MSVPLDPRTGRGTRHKLVVVYQFQASTLLYLPPTPAVSVSSSAKTLSATEHPGLTSVTLTLEAGSQQAPSLPDTATLCQLLCLSISTESGPQNLDLDPPWSGLEPGITVGMTISWA